MPFLESKELSCQRISKKSTTITTNREEIKTRLAVAARASDPDACARENFDWDDPSRRYSKCVSKLGNAAVRIQYFRQIVHGAQPSFSHHAVALLMQHGCIKPTCLTTNFDKLLEMAFAQQAVSEIPDNPVGRRDAILG